MMAKNFACLFEYLTICQNDSRILTVSQSVSYCRSKSHLKNYRFVFYAFWVGPLVWLKTVARCLKNELGVQK